MPLWKIYHPENAFSDDDKQAIAERVTASTPTCRSSMSAWCSSPCPRRPFHRRATRRRFRAHLGRPYRPADTRGRDKTALPGRRGCWRPISPSADCAGKSTSTRRRSACGPSRTSARPCPARPRASDGASRTGLSRHKRRAHGPRRKSKHAAQQRRDADVRLEADTRRLRQVGHAIHDASAFGHAAEGLEGERIQLGAAQPQSRRHMQAEQVPAMRPERPRGPAARQEFLDDSNIGRQAVAMRGIEDQYIAIRTQAAMPRQQARLLRREQASPAAIGDG